ncbi:MoaD/ThiS family protein [Hymenobacter busanensis]|uniref:Molybdopterin synthase sulfur carrier subunit n=1 Tax=Hymenobacter busanensis TaxID=2607656 RepID=A0A7L4ZSN8_9BACT|nr:MoaD/ThiS family protein [Hymenobacter busanensis]KAA9327544.1 MoaD/ThiS family protein [Hymenobacter busanensis]QHJ06118.1 molybdopterin synthase sulfur carrier subunit [Hymenobacter busanensis]
MNLSIALFGITREIVGSSVLQLDVPEGQSVDGLLTQLRQHYPALGQLSSLAVAVNNEYAEPTDRLHERDDVALIPPVSGG